MRSDVRLSSSGSRRSSPAFGVRVSSDGPAPRLRADPRTPSRWDQCVGRPSIVPASPKTKPHSSPPAVNAPIQSPPTYVAPWSSEAGTLSNSLPQTSSWRVTQAAYSASEATGRTSSAATVADESGVLGGAAAIDRRGSAGGELAEDAGRTYGGIRYTTMVYMTGPWWHACCAPGATLCFCAMAARRSPPPRPAPRSAGRTAAADRLDESPRQDHVSRAYEELRRIIVWGQLPPGSRISERIIADRLKLSRTPVRSALHRLEQAGFVRPYGVG